MEVCDYKSISCRSFPVLVFGRFTFIRQSDITVDAQFLSHRQTNLHHKYYDATKRHFRSSQRNCFHLVLAEVLCTEKNSGSKLCRQVELMRQQLEEINTDRQEQRKMLREQNSLLEKTNKNIVAISRSLQDVRDSQPKQVILQQFHFLLFK